MNTAATLEIMPDQQKEILAVVQQNALPQEQAISLQTSFAPLFKEAGALISQSRVVVVADVSQVAQIKLSREYRLLIRKLRIKGENTRKELKEASLRTGKAIDAMNTILVHTLSDEEARLEGQEKIVERAELARIAALEAVRAAELAALGVSLVGLGAMADETYAQLLFNSRAGYEAKIAAENKAREEKIAAEAARLKEEAHARAELARLKAEAEVAAKLKAEADAAMAAERAAAMAEVARIKALADDAAKLAADKAKAEREAAELIASQERAKVAKLEAEAQARADAERAAVAQQQAAARKAAAAPDRAKLAALAAAVRSVQLPALHADNAPLAKLISEQCAKLADWIEAKASQL
jgi:hypothetical protein